VRLLGFLGVSTLPDIVHGLVGLVLTVTGLRRLARGVAPAVRMGKPLCSAVDLVGLESDGTAGQRGLSMRVALEWFFHTSSDLVRLV
jgi:hypothetical protein